MSSVSDPEGISEAESPKVKPPTFKFSLSVDENGDTEAGRSFKSPTDFGLILYRKIEAVLICNNTWLPNCFLENW